jgi:cytochrome c peroxidase
MAVATVSSFMGKTIAWVVIAAAVAPWLGCSEHKDDEGLVELEPPGPAAAAGTAAAGTIEVNPRLLRRFQPLPADLRAPAGPADRAEIDLGRDLYYDKRLSKDGDISCNSCHDLADYGVDHQRFSLGQGGQRGGRNAPTVYNSAGFFVEFWDGRAPNVEEQAKGPVCNPVEMAMPDGAHVVTMLKAIPGYVTAFGKAFPAQSDPVTFDNVGQAIGAFERGLVTPGRWDDYLRGKTDALTREEKRGLKTFLDVGCMVCHTGAYLGGSMFERAGAVEPWPNQADRGRQQVTRAAGDGMMFKVPTLRNVAKTAPYFHDGSAATLPEAVKMMGRYQLGLDLSDEEVSSIVTWLGALTGDLPRDYVAPPVLP